MKKTLLISIFFVLFTSGTVLANPASMADGRAALFNHGVPTCSGIIAANNQFRAVVTEDPANQEANFFYALTRLLVTGLEQGPGPEFATLLDLFEAFGITRTANEDILNQPVYTELQHYAGGYLLPTTVPEAGLISQFFETSFVTLLDDVLANLSIVDNTINITLTPSETGDTAVEIDFGDILLFKSVVNTLKGLILNVYAYDMDGIDTAELIRLCQADFFVIQRDLIDMYPSALALITNGGPQLTAAKSALMSAIDHYQDALFFITAEKDNQNDDLFSFNEEDLSEAMDALAYLQEAKSSLDRDRPAEYSVDNNVDRYDFNAIFGSASKKPLDIRENLPQFNTDSEPVKDTFPGTPVLNGFLPDKPTNQDLTIAFDLMPADPEPSIDQGIIILTEALPNSIITAGSAVKVYGTVEVNYLIVENGAHAELINFQGNNTIRIQSDSSLFTVFHSGATVTFEGTDGTVLKIPATASIQTIIFNDIFNDLVINNNKVMFGTQEVNAGADRITNK